MTELRSAIMILSVLGALTFWSAMASAATIPGPRGQDDPPAAAATAKANDAPPAEPELSPEQARDLEYDTSNLLGPNQSPGNRATAAERLLSMNVPQAYDSLSRGLLSREPAVIDAIIVALNKGPNERAAESLLPAATEAMASAPADLIDRLAFAMIRYGDRIVSRVVTIARDQSLSREARIGAMRTLGIVPSRESGATLMAIANPANNEPETLQQVAFENLKRLATVDHGNDYAGWRTWWQEAQRKSREVWTAELIQRWFVHASNVEKESVETTRRYVALLREVYLERSLERQFERLPIDLEDSMHQVRLFALERIGVLVRDSVPIPENIQLKVISCLEHPRAEIRRRSASLLVELDHPQLPVLLSARLNDEQNASVAQNWLEALALRPHPDGAKPALFWLQRETTSVAAARALWSIMTRTAPADVGRDELAAAAGKAWRKFPGPATARLAALLVPADDLASLEELLRSESSDVVRGISEGLLARGRTAPLLANPDNEAVYPFALRAVNELLPTLEGLQLLLNMPPPQQHVGRWEDAVRTVTRQLPPDSVADADDLIAETGIASASLRETILNTALLSEDPAPGALQIGRLLQRLVPILIDQSAALRAYELLGTFTPRAAEDADLDDLRFDVTLLIGRFDEAAGLSDDPSQWIDTLSSVAGLNRDAAAAERLHGEILRRFGEDLTPPLRERMAAAAERIAAAHARNGNGNGPGNGNRDGR